MPQKYLIPLEAARSHKYPNSLEQCLIRYGGNAPHLTRKPFRQNKRAMLYTATFVFVRLTQLTYTSRENVFVFVNKREPFQCIWAPLVFFYFACRF